MTDKIEQHQNVILPLPVVDLQSNNEDQPRPSFPSVLHIEMPNYELKIATNEYPNPLEMTLSEEARIIERMLDALLPSGAAIFAKSILEGNIETQ